ncbi:MAG: hypothetical protein H0W67_03075 [Gemmatimonadales bacterium]|nr:hypothetical protein [Gemmatimonadales bacterium]
MPQSLRVASTVTAIYLALAIVGCRSEPGRLVPVESARAAPAQVTSWVGATQPSVSRLHRFKWLFRDERSSAGGRGSARVAPPDSLRFDVAGPFGSGAAAAVVVGAQAVWVDPPNAVRRLIPNYTLLWALLGVARPPTAGATLRGFSKGDRTVWQYAAGTDTIEYSRSTGQSAGLTTEVRAAGKLIGRAETTLGSDGAPLKSRLTVPSAPARLDITFLSTAPKTFAPETWLPRRH